MLVCKYKTTPNQIRYGPLEIGPQEQNKFWLLLHYYSHLALIQHDHGPVVPDREGDVIENSLNLL